MLKPARKASAWREFVLVRELFDNLCHGVTGGGKIFILKVRHRPVATIDYGIAWFDRNTRQIFAAPFSNGFVQNKFFQNVLGDGLARRPAFDAHAYAP